MRVLLTGATGFVGQRLHTELTRAGHEVVCASRDPAAAALKWPSRRWRKLDVLNRAEFTAALTGMEACVFLVHAMSEGAGYAEREVRAAENLRLAGQEVGLARVVYLGGPAPASTTTSTSAHLESRLHTGRVLRDSDVPTIELRAGMIIGAGSESWKICRDLALRLPIMIWPRWLSTMSQPVAISDVVRALCVAVALPPEISGAFDIPGPETLSAEQILRRTAAVAGMKTVGLRVPLLSPQLSTWWLKLVTRADLTVARQLVEGLRAELVSTGTSFWSHMSDHQLMSVDEAIATALNEDRVGFRARAVERLSRAVAAKPAG